MSVFSIGFFWIFFGFLSDALAVKPIQIMTLEADA
jgi:hypothetical protein